MTHLQNTIRVRIAIMTIAALTLVLASVPRAQATGLPNCNESGSSPCFEMVWVNGVQVPMTFAQAPFLATPNAKIDPFYVIAPQTDTPQGGTVPFFHHHVVSDAPQPPHSASHPPLHGP